MRNLKKILALVLALVMSLSLMATASAAGTAAATDAATAYKTAIDVLTGLKVVIGDAGGIRANDEITRAEAATLIYRVHTADVTDSKVYLHTDHPFTDVASTSWMNSYVSYAHNAQIVKGKTTTTFEPGVNITGYETLAMTLRALGYGKNGEFEGGEWKIQTAAWSQRIGLFNGISAIDSTDYALNQNASRGFVFQVMFNAVLMDQVAYSAYTPDGYSSTGKSMADGLGLEDLIGVVVANEIADLDGSSPLAEGRTNMVVGEKTYKLNLSTTAEEIGTAIHAYIKGNDVLAREDAGTDINDNAGAKTKVKDLADGLRLTDDTEYYVNYDPILKDTSDWRLEYVVLQKMTDKEAAELVKANGGVAFIATNTAEPLVYDAATDSASRIDSTNVDSILAGNPDDTTDETYTYDKVIPVEQIITSKDHSYIKDIFYGSDSFNDDAVQGDDIMTGEVYVATRSGKSTSVDKSYDISDELNYKEFYEKYIDDDKNRSFDACDRGEWLRVIDNDNDGVADYVLRVDFVMTTITDYDKRTDTYTVEYDKDEKAGTINDTAIKASDIAVMSEDTDLSVGAVVLYTLIDGVYHVCNPQVDTYAIEKKTIDIKTETFTANGEEYTWSGIDKEAAEYYKELVELDEEVTYDLYLDHFGFVRLATEASKGLILLTDGYFTTNYRESEYKATAWTGSALEDIDVVDNGTWKLSGTTYDGFIDTFEDDHDGNRGTWLRLNGFGEYYYNDRTITLSNGSGNSGIQDTYNTSYHQYHYVDRDDAGTNRNNLYVGDPFYTNIAAYTEEDGVYSLYDVRDTNILTTRRTYNAYEIAGTENGYAVGNVAKESVKAKNRTLYGINQWSADNAITMSDLTRVQTTADTVYYFVADASNAKKLAVTSWTGYENVPEELGNFVAKRAYMVTHEISDTDEYEIADVVVFEGAKGEVSYDAYLIVSAINTKRERSLGKDDEGAYGETNTNFEVFDNGQTLAANLKDDAANTDGLQAGQAVFVDQDGDRITSNFAKYGIYAATVVSAPGTRNRNYCEIQIDADEKYFTGFYTSEINAYELDQDTDEGAHASRNLAVRDAGRIDMYDKLIVMCDKDMNVLMAVNVDKSGKDGERDGSIQKLNGLWDDIKTDQDTSPVKYTVTIDKVTTSGGSENLKNVIELVDGNITEDAVKDFTLEFTMLNGAYSIEDVETEDATVAKVGNVWHLFNITGDVKLTIIVVSDGKHTLTQASGTERYATDTEVSLDESIDGSYFTVSDEDGNFYKSDGAKWAESDGIAAKFIPTWTVASGKASVAKITMPNADVMITDGYYGVSTAFDGNKYAREGETVTVTVSSATETPYWFITYEDGTIVWLENAKFGTGDQEYVKTGEFTMPAQNVSDTDGRNTYYKVVVDGRDEEGVYVKSRETLDISDLVTGDYFGYDLNADGIPTKFNNDATDAFTVKSSRADEDGIIHVLSGYYEITLQDENSLVDRVEGGIKVEDAYYFTADEKITIVPKSDKTFTVNGGSTVYSSIDGGYTTAVKGSAKLTIAAPTT